MGNDPFLSAGTEQTGSAPAVSVSLLWVFSPLYKAYPFTVEGTAFAASLEQMENRKEIVVVPAKKIRDITVGKWNKKDQTGRGRELGKKDYKIMVESTGVVALEKIKQKCFRGKKCKGNIVLKGNK